MRFLTPLLITTLTLAAVPALMAAKAAMTPAFSAAEAGTYAIDGTHSTVMFKIKHLDVANNFGRFNDVQGAFVLGEKPEDSSLRVTVAANSVDTNNEDRDKHLRSPDFLSVKEFPVIQFTSKAFKKTGDTTYDVTGTLDFHGVKKDITVPVEFTGARDAGQRFGFRGGLEAQFTILRRDYGVETYGDEMLSNEIHFMVGLEGIRQDTK